VAIVVSDTSPIRALAHLGVLDLLRDLFGEVLVPPAVVMELLQPRRPVMPVVDVVQLPFVRVQAPHDQAQVQQFLQTLDLGESEALALALEVQATTILIDESTGRAVVEQLGLEPLGALGILVRGKRRGLVSAVRPLMERLENELKFFVSAQVRSEVLQLAGE
jgi:predicted nucleic acid-binding protein